ncbi:acyltransferase [Shewanella hafniensis]|nr:acyltransferase [Shewanella hafniensis]
MAVVLYHFGVPGFAGGFVGVDVFFVLSGFLMTGIIITGLERSNFSLWGFYLARARRIIPALLVLCASLLIFGWFWLPNADYKMLAGHVGTAVAFVSNLKFWREAGYFDAASHEKWLLHTWSLSVEWQFYILLPLGCLLLWHWLGKRGVKLILIAAGLFSLALSVYASHRWPGAAFYLLPTRAWEMLAGGLVWWATRQQAMPRQWALLAEGIGFALIIWAIATFDPTMLWPGYLALVPVMGAMLVLAANRQHSWLTANQLAHQLGASSYSIYLWHWPLVVLLTYAGEQTNPQWIALGVLGSVLLGEFSLRWVENPTRKILSTYTKPKEYVVILLPVVMLCLLSSGVFILDGAKLPIRAGAVSDVSKYIDQYSRDAYVTESFKTEYKVECDFFNADTYTAKEEHIPASCAIKRQEHGVFLWGDSHAQALSHGLRNSLQPRYDFYQIASSGCQPHLGVDSVTTGQFKLACDRSNDAAIKAIEKLQPSLVIMAQRCDHDKNHYEDIVQHLKSLGVKHVVIIGPVPQWQPSLPRTIGLRHFNNDEKRFADNAFDNTLFKIDGIMKSRFSDRSDVTYISLLDSLCHEGKCLAKVDDYNTPLVWDYGHLSLPGSDFVVRNVLFKSDVLKSYLKQ